MEIEFNTKNGCLVVGYKNGQTNVFDKLLAINDLDNELSIKNKVNQICKKQNYKPKKFNAIKAIILIEE